MNVAKTKHNRKSFLILIQYDTYIYIGNDKKLQKKIQVYN